MAGKNTAVFGIYKNSMAAERAVDQILAAGFSNNDISVLLPDSQSSKDFAHEKTTKTPEVTTTGAPAGGRRATAGRRTCRWRGLAAAASAGGPPKCAPAPSL